MLDREGRAPSRFEEFSAGWLPRLNLQREPSAGPGGSLLPASEAPDSARDWVGANAGDRPGEPAGASGAPVPPGSTPATARVGLAELISALDGYRTAPAASAASAAGS